MKHLGFAKIASIVAVFCAANAITSPAQTYTTLLKFGGKTNGWGPAPLVQGPNGNLYGTTAHGGPDISGGQNPNYGYGSVFEITPAGKLTTIYNFCSLPNCVDGAGPSGPLVLGANGNFYGMTGRGGTGSDGGSQGFGTIFEITPGGKLTTLYSFCTLANCNDGEYPTGGLLLATNGNFYGATPLGGTSYFGTIFEITPAGKMTTLYTFCKLGLPCVDGSEPTGGLVQGGDGNLYGTATEGGGGYAGTVFKISPQGTLTTLYNFCSVVDCVDGASPSQGLLQGSDGNFYATTGQGGAHSRGTIYSVTPSGSMTVLHSFCALANCADGFGSVGQMIQGTDGNIYATTVAGGVGFGSNICMNGCGTFFKITPSGSMTTLYSFCTLTNCPDGAQPGGGVMQATNGTFYGTTSEGPIANRCQNGDGCGTVFSVSTGLGPFVESHPSFGKLGWKIRILGNNLTGTTSVTFNGTPATFTVLSNTCITAIVPTGATAGTIQVTTPSGTLSSNVSFQVMH